MPRILLAEDDDTMRSFLARSLEKAGYQVVSVGTGGDALPLLSGRGFDLLLTDIVMPGMDGIELARRATRMQPDLNVMFITGFAAVAMDKAEDRPANSRILQKPFHLKDMVDEVDRLFSEVV